MKKDYNKNFKHIVIKKDEEFEKFEQLCKQLGLKKATIISKIIKMFNKNPQKFLFN